MVEDADAFDQIEAVIHTGEAQNVSLREMQIRDIIPFGHACGVTEAASRNVNCENVGFGAIK